MFWRFGGYSNTSKIDLLLDKSDVTVEELLQESDLIQEVARQNSKLLDYLRNENVLDSLLQYIIKPKAPDPLPSDQEPTKEPSPPSSLSNPLSSLIPKR